MSSVLFTTQSTQIITGNIQNFSQFLDFLQVDSGIHELIYDLACPENSTIPPRFDQIFSRFPNLGLPFCDSMFIVDAIEIEINAARKFFLAGGDIVQTCGSVVVLYHEIFL